MTQQAGIRTDNGRNGLGLQTYSYEGEIQMDIARLGSHPLPVGPEVENTAIQPPSPGIPRETGSSEAEPSSANVSKRPLDEPTLKAIVSDKLNSKAWSGPGDEGPEESSSAHLSKKPLDDPALKAVLSEKLGGAGSGCSGPQIRMDRNIIGDDGSDDGGSDAGPEAPSGDGWGEGKNGEPKSLNSNDGNLPKSGDDNNGPNRGVGFNFNGRPGREGDGHTTGTSGGTAAGSGSTATGSNTSTSSSSSSSGTTGTSSTTTVHPQKK